MGGYWVVLSVCQCLIINAIVASSPIIGHDLCVIYTF